ncbi:MAG TPA: hypothetical protein VM076_17485 [Gemmatimonadaceae bacterium]|nr:hypothetical protein [Gemmatimonadaceae bacterium]
MSRYLAPLAILLLELLVAGCAPDTATAPVPPRRASPLIATATADVNEAAALAVSDNIQRWHVPYGTITDPIFADSAPSSSQYFTLSSLGYDRAADAATWTGHYLAAESFRYAVAASAPGLDNIRRAVDAIVRLVDVTGLDGDPNVLARFAVPVGDQYADAIMAGEAKHGDFVGTAYGVQYRWLGNTSRDQYSGVFFGLAVAYDLVPEVRPQVQPLVARLLDFLLRTGWNVVMPNGTTSTTFVGRADQQLTFLQIARHIDPAKYGKLYTDFRAKSAGSVGTPITYECLDPHGSYYKFNLDHINLYNLIRLEEPSSTYRSKYVSAFNTLRNCTGAHQNAHFNMIDRAVRGTANATRDAETMRLLGLWLQRRRRDYPTDVSAKYPSCGSNRSCTPVAIDERVNTDFLWQRSPFTVTGGKYGTQETAGVDYILPYWMARYYGVAAN